MSEVTRAGPAVGDDSGAGAGLPAGTEERVGPCGEACRAEGEPL